MRRRRRRRRRFVQRYCRVNKLPKKQSWCSSTLLLCNYPEGPGANACGWNECLPPSFWLCLPAHITHKVPVQPHVSAIWEVLKSACPTWLESVCVSYSSDVLFHRSLFVPSITIHVHCVALWSVPVSLLLFLHVQAPSSSQRFVRFYPKPMNQYLPNNLLSKGWRVLHNCLV